MYLPEGGGGDTVCGHQIQGAVTNQVLHSHMRKDTEFNTGRGQREGGQNGKMAEE